MTDRPWGQDTTPVTAAPAPLVAAPAQPRHHRKLGLRTALTGLLLLTVAITAILIHLTWFYAARRNVADVVGQLNRQIVGSVQHEVRATLNDAWSVQEAVRSIFFQEAIKPTDEAKREFIFLALLRSHSTLSWIALGFPDGAFFGALKAADDEIDMVEVKKNPETGIRQQRVDTYTPQPGDILFRGREITPSDYDATAQAWYQRAVTEDGPGWSMLSHLPYRDGAAIATSTPIVVNLDFAGVLAVVVELDRLSQFLASLQVGKTGTAIILGRNGRIVASAVSAARKLQHQGEMPELETMGRDHPMLAAVADLLNGHHGVSLADLQEVRQLQATSPSDGKDYFVTFSPLKFNNWVVATVIPVDDFLASIRRNAMVLLLALGALTLLVAGVAILSANRPAHRWPAETYRSVSTGSCHSPRLTATRAQRPLGRAIADEPGTRIIPEIHADGSRSDIGLSRNRGTPGRTAADTDRDVHRSCRLHQDLRAARRSRRAVAGRLSGSRLDRSARPTRHNRQVHRRRGDGVLGCTGA